MGSLIDQMLRGGPGAISYEDAVQTSQRALELGACVDAVIAERPEMAVEAVKRQYELIEPPLLDADGRKLTIPYPKGHPRYGTRQGYERYGQFIDTGAARIVVHIYSRSDFEELLATQIRDGVGELDFDRVLALPVLDASSGSIFIAQ